MFIRLPGVAPQRPDFSFSGTWVDGFLRLARKPPRRSTTGRERQAICHASAHGTPQSKLFSVALVFAFARSRIPVAYSLSRRPGPGSTKSRSTRSRLTCRRAPDEIIYSNLEHDPLFERAYRYSRKRTKTTFFTVILFSGARSDSNHDRVIIVFDDAGLVSDIAARLELDRPRYGGPWGDDDK